MRKMIDILLDLESILDEMVEDHGLQKGDVLALINTHLDVHNPDCVEVYDDDETNPVFYYGAKK